MQFTYIDYQDDFLKELVTDKRPRVYVFDNVNNLTRARWLHTQPFLEKESIFLTLDDLKEKLFPVDNIIIKEEKRSVLFYDLLTAEEKRVLNIDDYYDVAETANRFFDFYEELNEYQIDELRDLRDWQQKLYEIFSAIRERYICRLEKSGFTDYTLAFNFANYDSRFLNDFREIVFASIINFTPFERKLLKRLEQENREVELYLNILPGDFDEERLRLRKVSLPENSPGEIKLYQTDDDFLQLINMLDIVEEESVQKKTGCNNLCILDADFSNSNYHRLLSQGWLEVEKKVDFTETKIFQFLDNLYKIYSSSDRERGKMWPRLDNILRACSFSVFRDYYNINMSDMYYLRELAADGYVYITSDLIAKCEGLEGLNSIMDDLEQIAKIKNLNQFCSFLEGLDLKLLNDEFMKNNIDVFFDSLLELNSLQEMDLLSSWHGYFNDTGGGLFLLILNYLRYKKIDLSAEKEENTVPLKDLLTASHHSWNYLCILNASQGVLPSETGGNEFLLTEKQRENYGLRTAIENRREEKYYFMRHVLSSDRAVIFCRENSEDNISISSFVEELRLHYNLQLQKSKFGTDAYPEIIKNIFSSSNNKFKKSSLVNCTEEEITSLPYESSDFENNQLRLGFYKFRTLVDCYYKFYVQHLAGLEEEVFTIDRELSLQQIGILAHRIFAYCLQKAGRELDIEKEEVEKIINRIVVSYELQIDSYYKKYYYRILFSGIRDSVLSFFCQLKRRIKTVEKMSTEWSPDQEQPFYRAKSCDIYLSGRIDLLVESDCEKYIIDFKTGSGSGEQLDFYTLLLCGFETDKDLKFDFVESENSINKSLYDILERKFEFIKMGTEEKLADKIQEELDDFFERGEYEAIYKSRCDRCEYLEICRVVKQ